MPEANINVVAVVVAAVVNMGIGALWYSPILFAKQWLAGVGKKQGQLGDPGTAYVFATVAALVSAFVLAHLVDYVGAATALDGARTGLWAWLGFVATTMGVDHIFSGRSLQLYAINAAYHLLALVSMGALLAVWI